MWVRAGVFAGLSVVECSRVESFRTVGLDEDGLEVDVRPGKAAPEAVVVMVFWVTWLPEEPPSLGLALGGDAVRVLPLTAVVIVEMVEDTVVVVVVEEEVLSGPFGRALGLDKKMGSWPIPLASTRSVGT